MKMNLKMKKSHFREIKMIRRKRRMMRRSSLRSWIKTLVRQLHWNRKFGRRSKSSLKKARR
jgi:hypothetical protein